MITNKHALLSASSSHRWINCPPSARLAGIVDDFVSDFALEGTEAHMLCEYKLKTALGLAVNEPLPELSWYNEEMEDCANGYAAYVLEVIQKMPPGVLVLIEQKLDYSKYCPGGFGTGDCVLISDGIMHVIDYKHGRGIEVDANCNSQMLLYALGAIEMFGALYEIDDIYMTIYQPRRSNVSTYHIKTAELYQWVKNVLIPAAEQANQGTGNYKAGDWCQFCKVKTTCRERANENMRIAKLEFKEASLLTDEEISEVLLRLDELIMWANDIKDYALQSAISGKKWPGFKLVEGRSVRKYAEDEKVITTVLEAGYDPFEKKLIGITEMQKRLGKAKFDELLGSLLIKPVGKPTLVLESDKRPEFNAAKADFMTNKEEN